MQDRFNCPEIQKFRWRFDPIEPLTDPAAALAAAINHSALSDFDDRPAQTS